MNTAYTPNSFSKNRLQELLQKQHQDLPTYRTKQVAGQDHNPQFQSTVLLPGLSLSIKGRPCSKKKDAELDAAEAAYLQLSKAHAAEHDCWQTLEQQMRSVQTAERARLMLEALKRAEEFLQARLSELNAHLCPSCSTVTRDSLAMPCGHVHACHPCAERSQECLVCRARLTQRIRLAQIDDK